MLKNRNVERARNYAIKFHGDQKFGNYPYVFHLDMVHEIAVKFNLGELYEIAAYLHDLIEDTAVTKQDLKNNFGQEAAEIVFCVSGFGENRKEKQKDIYEKLQYNIQAINLKMCDRLANLIASKINKPKLFETYVKEYDSLNLDYIFAQGDKNLYLAIKIALGKNTENCSVKRTISL